MRNSNLLTVLGLFLVANPIFAIDYTWVNASGGNWSTAANWGGGPPGAGDNATLGTLSGPYLVSLTDTRSIANFTVNSADATLSQSGTLTVSGTFAVNAGTFNLSGGSLGGSGTVTMAAGSFFNWTGGGIAATSSTIVGGATTVSGASLKTLNGVLTNAGTLTWTGGESIQSNALGAGISNQSGATVAFAADGTPLSNNFGGTLTNAGTVRKSAGSGTTTVIWAVNSTGTLQVDAGTLSFTGGGIWQNTLQGAGTLRLPNNTYTIPAGQSLAASSLNTLTIDGATVSALGSFSAATTTNLMSGTINPSSGGSVTFPAGTTLNWTGGILASAGMTTNSGSCLVTGAGLKTLNGVLTNAGTLTWTGGGSIQSNAPGAGISDQSGATVDFAADGTPYINNFGGTLTNAGTVRKSAGSGTTTVIWAVNNTGTVQVDAGTLSFTSGGTLRNTLQGAGTVLLPSGTYTVPASQSLISSSLNALTIDGATVTALGSFSGAATTNFVSGTISPSSGGSVSFPIGTTFNWTGGILASVAGTTTISGTATVSGTSTKTLNGVLTNAGTLTWAGSGSIQSNAPGAGISNQSGATIDFTADGTALSNNFGGTLTNAGTVRKSAGNGTTTVIWAVNSTGTIQVDAGTLSFTGGGTLQNILQGTGTLRLPSNTYTIPAGQSLTASSLNTLTIEGAIVNVSGSFSGAATTNFISGTISPSSGGSVTFPAGTTLNWTGGSLASVGTTTLTGTATVSGPITKTLNGVLTNTGTLTWMGGGSILSNPPGIGITNQSGATIDFTADGTALSNNFGGTLTNAGTVRKSAGGGMTTVEWATSNAGQIQGNSGTLRFAGNFSQPATGSIVVNGGTVSFSAPLVAQGLLAGNGTIVSSSATHSNGTIRPGLSAGQLNLQANLTLNASSTFAVELGGMTQGVNFDFLNVTGTANLGGAILDLRFIDGFENTAAIGNQFTVLGSSGTLSGQFAGLADNTQFQSTDGLRPFRINYNANSVVLTVVPEPSLTLAGLAILTIAFYRRRPAGSVADHSK